MLIPIKKTLLFVFIAILLAVSYYYLKQPKPITVKIYAVEKGQVKSTVSNTRVGTIKACRRAFLAPATGGEVAKLHVKEGDVVKKRQLLLEVWNDDLKAQVELQTAEVTATQATAKQACLLAAGAERDAVRLKKLQQHNQIVSENDVDDAVTTAQANRAACQSAKAAIQVSQARLKISQAAVQRTMVFAPFDGTVAEVNVELNEFVTPSPPGILTLPAIDLLDVSCLYISAPIDEVDAPRIKLGMKACVSLDAFTEKRCSGKVTRIAPYVLEKEKQARTVEVEVKLSDPKETLDLLPGYSADIEVILNSKEQTLRVPTEAILENNRLMILNDDGVLEERDFQPGLSNWNYTEVLTGLDLGEQVVLSIGLEGVEAGNKAIAEQ
jgi:HlyD family secretion protein